MARRVLNGGKLVLQELKQRGFRLNEWTVRPLEGRILSANIEKRLSPKSVEVLLQLAEEPGRVFTREELLKAVWGQRAVTDEPLTRCISELRRKLSDSRMAPKIIETIPKRGYRLIAGVESLSDPNRQSKEVFPTRPDSNGSSGAASTPNQPGIAVLPFINMSGDPEQEYFSDGIAEDIITNLSKISGLFVIARSSSFTYKGKSMKVQEISKGLGVSFVLEGGVRKADNRVRITTQLVDGVTGRQVWAERYDRDLVDIFEVQDDVTQQIVSALKITLSEVEESLIVDGGTKNVDSHDLFMRGRQLLFGLKRDREMFDKSMAYFRRAIELDPDYAGPYAGLGHCYMLDHQNHWSDASEKSLDKAEYFAREAIAKDDKDPFAHYAAAVVAMFKKDYEKWTYEADKALSLNPNYALAIFARGIVHIYTGEPVKAIPYIERAMRLDPAFQQQYFHFLGTAYFVVGDYKTAATLFKDRISITPTTDLSRAFLASTLGHLGQLDEAQRIWNELKEINPEYSPVDHISRLPFRNPADAEKFTDGLRKAGLMA